MIPFFMIVSRRQDLGEDRASRSARKTWVKAVCNNRIPRLLKIYRWGNRPVVVVAMIRQTDHRHERNRRLIKTWVKSYLVPVRMDNLRLYKFNEFFPLLQCGQSLKGDLSDESDIGGDSTQSQPVELTTNSSMDSRHDLTPHFNNLSLDHPIPLLHHRNPQVSGLVLLSFLAWDTIADMIHFSLSFSQDCGPENSTAHVSNLSALPLTPPHSEFPCILMSNAHRKWVLIDNLNLWYDFFCSASFRLAVW